MLKSIFLDNSFDSHSIQILFILLCTMYIMQLENFIHNFIHRALFVRACVRACVRARARACVCVF